MPVLNLSTRVIITLILQNIGVLFLVAESVYILSRRPSILQLEVAMSIAFAIIYVIGYDLELMSTDTLGMLNGIKIEYLGQSFTVFFLVLFVSEFCNSRWPSWLITTMTVFHSIIVILVFTCNYHRLFYTSCAYDPSGFAPHLILGHSPIYFVNLAVIGAYFAFSMFLCIREIIRRRKKDRSVDDIALLLTSLVLALAAYALFAADLSGGYDTSFLACLIVAVTISILFIKYRIMDTLPIAKNQALRDSPNGFIFFNEYNDPIYTNKTAQKLLGRIEDGDEMVQQMHKLSFAGENIFFEGHVFQPNIRPVMEGSMLRGRAIELTDITDSYYSVSRLEHDVAERTKDIKEIQRSVIAAFANIIEMRDDHTGSHIKNTGVLIERIALSLRERGLFTNIITDRYVELLKNSAPMHDIGKIAIPDAILKKPAKLTPEEFEVIKKHTSIGAGVIESNFRGLESNDYVDMAKDITLYHHEKWDGTGYPLGLSGDAIPVSARIMALVDVYDALISERPYKPPYSQARALEIIREGMGSHFDPEIAEVFIDCINSDIYEIEQQESVHSAEGGSN